MISLRGRSADLSVTATDGVPPSPYVLVMPSGNVSLKSPSRNRCVSIASKALVHMVHPILVRPPARSEVDVKPAFDPGSRPGFLLGDRHFCANSHVCK